MAIMVGYDPAVHKRLANDDLLRDSAESAEHDTPIGFLCECSSADCFRTVWLTRAEFDVQRAQPGHQLLAPAH
jgi:hypothetical protein